jgi:hypothetical protein
VASYNARVFGTRSIRHQASLALLLAAVIGAILIHPLLPLFEAQTDTRSEALGAYLTCIVTIAGIGPGLTAVRILLSENSIIHKIFLDVLSPNHILSLLKL